MTYIGQVYAELHDYPKALEYFNKVLNIAQKSHDPRREANASMLIGKVMMEMHNYEEAKRYFQSAHEGFIREDNQLRIANCNINFGELYIAGKDYGPAIQYLQQALTKGILNRYPEVNLQAANLLQKIYVIKGDSVSAYRYAIIGNQWKDTLNKFENKKSLIRLEAQYQYEQEKHEKAIRQQRRDFFTILILILLCTGLIILFLFWTRQKARVRNAILEKGTLEKEIEFKNKEMIINVMSVLKKNEFMSDISRKLAEMEKEAETSEAREVLRRISKDLQKNQDEEIWKEFSVRFKDVHRDFYDRLSAKFPNLSPNDLKLCAFLRLNLTSKEIAELTGQRIATLENARYRLRQKFGISNSDINLVTFLSQF
jgi:tetratricopeptide (TPR) repeat protein